MPRAIWSGSVSFGLVNVPVKLVTAQSPKDVRFHQLHGPDGGRIHQKRVCSVDGEEVEYQEIVKGYELGPGRYVVVEPEELASIDVEATRTIDIEEFVDLADIDPIYFEKSYYLVPDGRAEKPYSLLVETMQRTGKVAIGRFVLRSKQYLATLRAHEGVLVLATMLYADEVVDIEELEVPTVAATAPSKKELEMASQLVESLSAAFDPSKYQDDYREKVLALIEAKADGEVITPVEEPVHTAPVVDLMEALEASLAKVKKHSRVSPKERRTEVHVGGRSLSVSNLDKVLWPATGFTKGQLIDYYARVAEVMVPHLAKRPITLRRWPNGVAEKSFFQKNCPSHRPEWMGSVRMGDVDYCLVDEAAALVWAANMAAIELHPGLACAPDLAQPTFVVFDLDPGPPADVLTCAKVALVLRDYLDRLGLRAWPKTSGSKGLQLYVPVAGSDYEQTKRFSLALARLAEKEHGDLVVSAMDPAKRRKKVMIDWSQNTASKTTVGAYSVRALEAPSVSTPVRWDELEGALGSGDPGALRFDPSQVLDRVERHGDLHAPVLETTQALPALRDNS